MPFKYLFIAIIISIGCAIDAGLPAVTLAQVPAAVSSEGETLLEAARIEFKNKRYPEAIRILEKAVVIFEANGNLKSKAISLKELGDCYSFLNQYFQAIDYYQKALQLATSIGHRDTEGRTLNNLGLTYQKSGKYPEAIDYYQLSLKIARQSGNRSVEVITLENLGNVFQKSGKYPEAIDYHQQALKIARQSGNLSSEGVALGNLGNVSKLLGKYPEAIDYYQQALKIARQSGNRSNEGNALGNLGNVSQSLRQYSEAINYHQQALKISRQIGNLSSESVALRNLGIVSQSLRQYSEAINYHQQALKISRQISNRSVEGDVLGSLGIVSQSLGQYSEAIDYHQQALKISRQIGNRSSESIALNNLGKISQMLGKYPEAIDYLQQATNIKDSLRNGLKDEDKVSLFQTQINSYKQLTAALLQNQDLSGSLIATERGRARAFSDLLSQRLEANPTITKPNSLNFSQIQEQARSRQATIVSYSILPVYNEPGNSKIIVHIISSTGKLIVRELLSPKSVDLGKLVNSNRTELLASRSSNKLTIDRLKPKMLVRLNGDEPDTRRQIVTVDAQKQTIVLQGIGQNTRETEEVAFSDIAGIALPKDRPELRQLHQLLIAPIADLLPTNPLAPVIFIPDGALYEVPFAALKNERGQYLIDLHTISIAPSLSILAQTAQLKQRNIPRTAPSLVIGNPDFSKLKQRYEQLQFSGDEARGVSTLFPSQLLLGDRATESAVKQSLPTARIAHFATHGIRDGVNGLNSGIVLTPSGTDSGILTAEKVLDLKLNADLVVLSACDTGRGKITGDGVIGLSRSFITAGANSVIVSLWSVDDKATAMLMTDFYRQWQGGKNKVQALRAAMLNTKAQYPDPYYWSSMSLYGEID